MEALEFAVYVAVKCVAYVGWCWVGLRLLDPDRPAPFVRATSLGIGRLAFGVVIGLTIFVAALSMNNATRNAPLTYFSIYVPVRVVEWTIWHVFVSRKFAGVKSVGWVLGGVVVSCLADIPLGIMEGGVVPVGRPFC